MFNILQTIQDKADAFLTETVTALADEYLVTDNITAMRELMMETYGGSKFSPDCHYQVLDIVQDWAKNYSGPDYTKEFGILMDILTS